MAQFSVEIIRQTGPLLSGNQQSPKIVAHSLKLRFVVMTTLVRS